MQASFGAASQQFSADRDFHELRAEGPESSADMVQHWREALDSVARVSYLTHCSQSGYEPCRGMCISIISAQ